MVLIPVKALPASARHVAPLRSLRRQDAMGAVNILILGLFVVAFVGFAGALAYYSHRRS
jgi:hypothetical protein